MNENIVRKATHPSIEKFSTYETRGTAIGPPPLCSKPAESGRTLLIRIAICSEVSMVNVYIAI